MEKSSKTRFILSIGMANGRVIAYRLKTVVPASEDYNDFLSPSCVAFHPAECYSLDSSELIRYWVSL